MRVRSAKLSIIIVSYNTRDMTLACLRSVYDQTRDTAFEILVVDNASTDGSADAIAAEFPQVRLWARDDNLGFAGGNNFAAQHATGDWLLLLNPDTVVLDGAIDKLVAFAEQRQAADPAYGIFGGRTLFADGTLNATSCWAKPTLWSLFCLASGLSAVFRRAPWAFSEELRGWARDTVREVDIVTGCFLLLRSGLWGQLRGFDLSFFMYGEEADLCLRARRLGARGVICPDATIVHYGGASEPVRGDKLVRIFTAKIQLVRKHWSPTSASLGITLLHAWAFTRMVGFGLIRFINPRAAHSYSAWRTVWTRRSEWATARLLDP